LPISTNLAGARPALTSRAGSPASERALNYVGRDGSEVESSCPRCFGSGMEIVPGRGARRCGCRSDEARRRLLESARIPRRYEGCTLRGYHPAPGNASQLLAFNLAFRLVHDYPAVDRGLLLTGPCGVGKTHPSNYPCRADSCAMRDRHGY